MDVRFVALQKYNSLQVKAGARRPLLSHDVDGQTPVVLSKPTAWVHGVAQTKCQCTIALPSY